jgi:hypothetical protein
VWHVGGGGHNTHAIVSMQCLVMHVTPLKTVKHLPAGSTSQF